MEKIAITTDSTAYIPEHLKKDLPIYTIPLHVVWNNESYRDGIDIKPKDLGGKAKISNGQTLCAQHNFQKKNYKQTETGKKMFIRLYVLAKEQKDIKLQNFCSDVLQTYEEHDINSHIEWKK